LYRKNLQRRDSRGCVNVMRKVSPMSISGPDGPPSMPIPTAPFVCFSTSAPADDASIAPPIWQ
jgi:hypothetical protein